VTVVAVSDTGPLIHLGEIRSLELLDAFDRLYVPETVYDELERGGVPDDLEKLSFDRLEPDELQPETTELDPGERAALAMANEREAVLLTDDLAARDAAVEHSIDVHGSLGVIAIAYAHGLVDRDEAATLMRALQRETSLFVTEAIVERAIRKLET
jgi:predicted nucleic acid-binding protein